MFLVNASSVASPTYKFYAIGTNTVLQSGSSLSYRHSIGYTTPIDQVEVTVTNGVTGCESPRTVLSINVTDPPTLTISQSGSVNSCVNKIETLSITSPTGNFTGYVWSPSTNLYANSNGTGSLGSNPTTVYYKRGTTTVGELITLTATQGACTGTANVTFVVTALPIVTSVTATPTPVCSGSAVTLNGTSISIGAGTATLGAGGTTSTSVGGTFLP
ncbi:MAG: hypothetical protein NTZ59_11400, partial [Bacteroidetes bacterium]|nr:hypothetical protein [Bacteroidota bacterium]